MATRGPRPKPAHLKLIAGNPGKRPIGVEPVAIGELPDAPDWLTPDQRTEYEWLREHAPAGLLKQIDRGPAIVAAASFAAFVAGARVVGTVGPLYRDRDGTARANPAGKEMRQYAALALRAYAELGITPTGRARLATHAASGEADPWAEMAGQG
jgi:P27 family predicted phage terminase small subunit